jgi:alpha-ketoglutarate-dependent taurine dioxygenase
MPIRHYGPRAAVRAERERLAGLRFERIGVTPLGATLGAEIHGADLECLDEPTFAEIERAFRAYKVVFFRDQDLSTEAHLAFARRFGPLEEHPFLPSKEGYDAIVRFAKDDRVVGVENVWHHDVTWRREPSLGSVLRAVEVPAVGGDTLFADMVTAYEGLDAKRQRRIDGLRAVHDFTHSFGLAMSPEELRAQQAKYPPAVHPVARTHPVTGRRCLFVNAIFTSHVEGLPREESDALLDLLYRQADVPEYQCRFRWEKNSVAFWDNCAVQHYAASDYDPQPRAMERVTIAGGATA